MPHKLNIAPDFSDYQIFGISTHLKDYKLCWLINKFMQTALQRHPDLHVEGFPPRNYSLYYHNNAFEQIDLYLLSNYYRHIPWFAKAKHFHYFFIIRGNPLSSQMSFFENTLKSVPQMLLVTKLSVDEKKLAQPLLTDFELHLTETAAKVKEVAKGFIPKRSGIKKQKNLTES